MSTCYHCGLECPPTPIEDEGKVFCCSGCATVYQLLKTNGLSDYYRLEDRQAPRPEKKTKYGWLEDEGTVSQLLEFQSEQLARTTFHLPTMHCAACIWLLEHLYRVQPGILRSEVDFPRKELALDYDPSHLSLKEVVELLDLLGYPPKLSLADTEGKTRDKRARREWYNLGIAGFCFGNIMMLSFPEYLGIHNSSLATLFNYVILGLSLPVLYSSRTYFRSAWAGFRNRYINMDLPIALGIAVLFLRSSWDVFSGHGHGYFDSLAGLIFFLLIGKIYQDKTYHLLSFDRDYRSYFPISVTRVHKGREEQVPIRKLQADDTVLIRNGELIPSDGQLVTGKAEIDYSFVTGESVPIPVQEGEAVYAGGRQVGAAIQVKLTKKTSEGYLTKLWNHTTFRKTKDAKVSALSGRIARWFTPLVLLVALSSAAYWYFVDPSQIWNVVTSVLIVACPCALALSTPFTLGHILRILGKRGLFLKGPAVVERLAELDQIVFDKTGTLTWSGAQGSHYQGSPLNEAERSGIKALVRESVHPLSRRLYEQLESEASPSLSEYREFPGKGLEGSVENTFVKIGSRKWLQAPPESVETQAPASRASEVAIEINGIYKGVFTFPEEVRDGVGEMVERLGQDHQISLISGDHDHNQRQWQARLPQGTALHFQQSPEDKLHHVAELQEAGRVVAMVGDGLNDSGALQKSDVGIAVTDELAAFTPASDAILQGHALPLMDRFIRLSKMGLRLIHFSFVISLLYNLVGLWFAVNGELSPLIAAILMPASSLTVVLFTTLGVSLSAKRILPSQFPTP